MPSRILLINFTEADAEKLGKNIPLVIERGYLSDVKELSKTAAITSSYFPRDEAEAVQERMDDLEFCFLHPVYEYQALFVNLNNNASLQKEYEGKTKAYTDEDRKDFVKYWFLRGSPLVIFLGDYNYRNLFNLGVPELGLTKVKNADIALNSIDPERSREVGKLFSELKSDVIVPTNFYIQESSKSVYQQERAKFKTKFLYWNNNNEDLGIFIESDEGYSSNDRPRVLVLPQFKNNISVIEKSLRLFATLNPKYLPELPSSDWLDTDEYYPQEVSIFDGKIDVIVDEAQGKIENLKTEKEDAKKKFTSLRGLLHQTGDELKASVIEVLNEVFQVKTTDADASKEGGLLNEDVLIEVNGEIILGEIKGVKSENPSPIFIGQVWKHIHQSKDKNIRRGALILNYDLETNPKDRHLAYKGEYEKGLEDIIFIDSRIIFDLGIAIIDYGMPVSEAAAILFQNGRIAFDLKKYLEEKAAQSAENPKK